MKNVKTQKVHSFEDVDRELQRITRLLQNLPVIWGEGSPENVEYGKRGTLYVDFKGGTSTTLYIKESNDEGNSGWIAK